MQNFKKLSRAEMKNVKGGVNGGCNVDAPCSFAITEGVANGFCSQAPGGCECVTNVGSAASPSCEFI